MLFFAHICGYAECEVYVNQDHLKHISEKIFEVIDRSFFLNFLK